MKNITLLIKRSDLYAEVGRLTAYLGAKQAPAEDPGGHFDRMAVIDGDNPLLSRFANEALSVMVDRLKGIVGGVQTDSESLSVTLHLSDNYDDSLTVAVTENFEAYMAAAVTSRWLRLVDPSRRAEWQEESERTLLALTASLYHRNPPKRIMNA